MSDVVTVLGSDVRWIPVRAACRVLKVSKQRVHALCSEGLLTSIVYDGTRLVSLESVEARRRDRARGGG